MEEQEDEEEDDDEPDNRDAISGLLCFLKASCLERNNSIFIVTHTHTSYACHVLWQKPGLSEHACLNGHVL